jgi:ATP-dependent Clp protease ATP-binding subunit ClpC
MSGRSMFERYTDQARQVVVLTQQEARMLSQPAIGTEHVLLGLLHEGDGVAAKALESLGISLEAARQQVEEITGSGPGAPAGHLPYTPPARRVLEMSLREALHLGHNTIGTEHILLGLIRDGESVAAQVLGTLGAEPPSVRQQVIQLLQQDQEEPEAGRPAPRIGPGRRKEHKLLPELRGQVESMDSRLSAVERRVGTGPDVGDIERQIGHARRDKEAALAAEDYENAAALRDAERQLLAEKASRQEQWADAQLDLPSLAEGFRRLSSEVERLRELLRQHGIEPQDGAA